jgi:hypothetical protein
MSKDNHPQATISISVPMTEAEYNEVSNHAMELRVGRAEYFRLLHRSYRDYQKEQASEGVVLEKQQQPRQPEAKAPTDTHQQEINEWWKDGGKDRWGCDSTIEVISPATLPQQQPSSAEGNSHE